MTALLLAAASVSLLGQPAATDLKLLHTPSVHGDTVVFSYAGDLWKCSLSGGTATRLTTHPGVESNPRISPDGTMVAFSGSYDGNREVYVMPINGGSPKRLTYTSVGANPVSWTPTGMILFATQDKAYSSAALEFVSPEGGLPKHTVIQEFNTGTISADGSTVAYNRNNSYGFNWRRYRGGTQGVVSFYNLVENKYSELPHGRENNWHPMFVGDWVYYVSDKNLQNVNLYRFNTKNRKVEQLTSYTDGDIKMPNTDGKTVVFERNGTLFAYSIATGQVHAVTPSIVTDGWATRPKMRRLGGEITDLALSPNGKRLIVSARGQLFNLAAKEGETMNLSNRVGSREQNPIYSPDGRTVYFTSDRNGDVQLFSMPVRGGEPKAITEIGALKLTGNMALSPDGKRIALFTLDHQFDVIDLATKKITKIDANNGTTGDSFDWSPDSNYLAWIKDLPSYQTQTMLYSFKDGKKSALTAGNFQDGSVAFDLNGKYLYLTSFRTFSATSGALEFTLNVANGERVYMVPLTKDQPNPFMPHFDEDAADEPVKKDAPTPAKPSAETFVGDELDVQRRRRPGGAPDGATPPAGAGAPGGPMGPMPPRPEPVKDMKIDVDGFEERMTALPWGPGQAGGVIGLNNGVMSVVGGQFTKFDFDSKQSTPIFPAIGGFALNQSRTMFAYSAGGAVGILPLAPGGQPGAGKVNTDQVEAIVDPKAEWKQMLEEGWRYLRDRYYDPEYTGVDWNAMKAKYEALLPYVAHRNDLNYILGLMIGELGTSHAYVSGGEIPGAGAPVPVGTLGANLEWADGAVKIQHILESDAYDSNARSPLADLGLNVNNGDYILAIDGQKLEENTNPGELLMGKVGRYVKLKVNSKPTEAGSRVIMVKPISGQTEVGLKYLDWVISRKRMVDKLSGGRLGYAHVPNTSEPGAEGFAKGFFSSTDKDGLVIDERNNGGGRLPTYFYEKIGRKTLAAFRQRNGRDITFPIPNNEGPYVMLINQYAGSGGDMFPWLFRREKAGMLVGKRTWGGLVGIMGQTSLLDGGQLTAPEFGIYDPETGQWVAENRGIDPDIDIDNTPDQIALGRDPQLEKAVEVLMAEVKKHPKKPIKRPDYPRIKQ